MVLSNVDEAEVEAAALAAKLLDAEAVAAAVVPEAELQFASRESQRPIAP
jgi:hypothetical protein